jgi:hypothetical protein
MRKGEKNMSTAMKTWVRNILMVMAVILTALSLCACGTKTVDLNKYIKIETNGVNGTGTATVTFDQVKFAKDHDRHIKLSKEMSYLAQYANVSPAVGMYKDCVSGRLNRTSGLSNGDKITFSWNCSDAMAKQLYGVNLKYSDITYKVKNLGKIKTFDPFDFVTVSFSGPDSYGQVNIDIDRSNPETQYLRYTMDETEGLHNGDTITLRVEITCDPDEFASIFGETPKKTEREYKATGLTKVETFDPFAFITVEFTGTEPAGEMNYNADLTHPEIQYLRFDADKNNGLSNGETITISVSVNGDPESFISKFGKLPKDNEKVYTVSGLSKVVSSSSEIDEACLGAMKQQAEDVLRAKCASEFDEYEHLTSLEYVGMTFRMKKAWDPYELRPGSNINVCGLVYKVGVHCDDKHTGWFDDHDAFDIEYYSPVLFTYITKDENGNCSVDLMDYSTANYGFYTEGETNYFNNAFRTTDDLIESLLTCYRDSYYTESAIA